MAKRAKLANVGYEDADPVSEVEASFTPDEGSEVTQGVSNTVDNQPDPEDAADVETEQDLADQEAAGVGSNKAPAEMSDKAKLGKYTKKIVALGSDFGLGKVSMINLAETITEGAAERVISVGHIPDLYDKFRAASTKAASIDEGIVVPDEAIMDRLPDESIDKSRPQQISKLNRFVELGNQFTADAPDLIRRARNVHVRMLNGEDRPSVKPGSTYTHLVDIARKQMQKQVDAEKEAKKNGGVFKGSVDPMTDAEIQKLLSIEVKDDPEKDAADKIIECIKSCRSAQNGSRDGVRSPVSSPFMDEAIEALRNALVDENGGPENGEAKLTAYDNAVQDADEKAKAAAQKKLDDQAEKARKALEPKAPKAGTKKGPPKASTQAAA